VTAGFHRKVEDTCAHPGYYSAFGDNSLSTFRENLPVPSSRTKKCKSFFYLGRWER